MSKEKPPKKKVVVSTRKTEKKPQRQRRQATASRKAGSEPHMEMIFGKQNYILMGIGAASIALGMLLMSGGHMPGPDVWDPDIIYSFRRTVLAPIFILAGLVVEIFAIFKRSEPETEI